MAHISKELYDSRVSHCSCSKVIHTWHRDCTKATYLFVTGGVKGICIFFFTMYAVSNIKVIDH